MYYDTGMSSHKNKILAIGGGKGGVGKSYVSANLAIALAQAGRQTYIVDLDLGGANLHTLFGLKTTDRGIGDFIYHPTSPQLADYAVATGVDNLKLISGNGFIPGIANLEFQRKLRVIKALGQMSADYVVLDLGAGTNYNVIDFFTITQSGIIVTMHEPTAILNGYEFLKNVVFRIYAREFRNKPDVLETIERFKTSTESFAGGTAEALMKAVGALDAEAETAMRRLHADFRPAFIVNMSRADTRDFTRHLEDICREYLSVRVQSLGSIPYDLDVQRCCQHMRPYLLEHSATKIASLLRGIAMECTKANWLDADKTEKIEDTMGEDPAGMPLDKARSDSQLSSLLGSFIQESTAVTGGLGTAGVPVEAAPTEAPGAPAAPSPAAPPAEAEPDTASVLAHAAATAEVGLEFTLIPHTPPIRLPIEPRMRPDAEFPRFAPLTEEAAKGGMFGKLLGGFKASGATSTLRQEFETLRQALHAKDVMLTMKSLAERGARAQADGREWIRTGLMLVSARRYALAQQAFEYALACTPADETAINNLAASLMAMGKTGQALSHLSQAAERHRQNAFLRFNLGLAQMALKQHAEAAAQFVQVRGLNLSDRESFPAEFLEGYCRYRQHDYVTAESVYRGVVKKEWGDAYAQFNWALAKMQCGTFDQAIQTLTELIASSPEDFEALAARGLSYWKCQKHDQAINDYTKVLRLEPGNIAFYTARAAMACHAGRLDLAIADLQKIVRLAPRNETFQRLFEKIRRELERQQMAKGAPA